MIDVYGVSLVRNYILEVEVRQLFPPSPGFKPQSDGKES